MGIHSDKQTAKKMELLVNYQTCIKKVLPKPTIFTGYLHTNCSHVVVVQYNAWILHERSSKEKQSKVYSSHYTAIAAQWTSTGMPGTTQALESCAANPPGAGLVTRRRAVQVSRIKITEPKVPQWPHTTKQDKDSRAFASPVYTWYPLMSKLGGLLPQLTPGHHSTAG